MSRLEDLGREKAMDLLNEYGNKNCLVCGHSNWAHGKNGCSYDWGKCGCKEGKSNEEIIFRTNSRNRQKVVADSNPSNS
jgi:hypothetical protein